MPRIRANGVELYYELHGQGEQTIVFANGVLGNTAGWLTQMRMIEEQYAKLDYDAVVRLIARFREFNITAELAQIRVRALVIASEKDTLKPVKYSELIHQKITDSQLFVVKEAGHALTYEKPQEFNPFVLGFLEAQELIQTG